MKNKKNNYLSRNSNFPFTPMYIYGKNYKCHGTSGGSGNCTHQNRKQKITSKDLNTNFDSIVRLVNDLSRFKDIENAARQLVNSIKSSYDINPGNLAPKISKLSEALYEERFENKKTY